MHIQMSSSEGLTGYARMLVIFYHEFDIDTQINDDTNYFNLNLVLNFSC